MSLKTKRICHNYLCSLPKDIWEDLKILKKLDPSRSINSLITEGVRVIVAAKIQEMLEYRQDEETLRRI